MIVATFETEREKEFFHILVDESANSADAVAVLFIIQYSSIYFDE